MSNTSKLKQTDNKTKEIESALQELKKMQKYLDDPDEEVSFNNIRNILGHVVFSLVVLIEENNKVRDKINKVFEQNTTKINIDSHLYS